MFSATQRAQTEVPGACLWIGDPQFGDISRGVHRKEKPGHRFCNRKKTTNEPWNKVSKTGRFSSSSITENNVCLLHVGDKLGLQSELKWKSWKRLVPVQVIDLKDDGLSLSKTVINFVWTVKVLGIRRGGEVFLLFRSEDLKEPYTHTKKTIFTSIILMGQ